MLTEQLLISIAPLYHKTRFRFSDQNESSGLIDTQTYGETIRLQKIRVGNDNLVGSVDS